MKRLWRVAALLSTVVFAAGAFAQEFAVSVRGEVSRPGSYTLAAGERLTSLIERAGGFTENAWLRGAVLTRISARESQKRELARIVSKIAETLRATRGNTDGADAFFAALVSTAPLGRVPLHLSDPRRLKGSGDDIELEEGDDLFVPVDPGKVVSAGAVKTPGMSTLPPGRKYEEYVRAAGGYAEGADRDSMYLLRAEGRVIGLRDPWIRWDPGTSRWEITAFRRIRPPVESGDTIVVPRRPTGRVGKANARKVHSLLREIARITGTFVDPP